MVTYEDLNLISDILNSHSWYNQLTPEHQEDTFERFYQLIRKTTPGEERNIVYELAKNLENIDYNKLQMSTDLLVKCIPDEYIRNSKKVFFIPVGTEKESGNAKGGANVVGYAKATASFDDRLAQKRDDVHFLSSIDALKNFATRTQSLVILCDDFIGSGRQYKDCLNWYKQFKVASDTLILIVNIIHSLGLHNLSEHNNILYDKEHRRGITDNDSMDTNNSLSIMKKFEKRLHVPKRYSLGVDQCEALIAIGRRAPNNTFPIFWCSKRTKLLTIFGRM